MSHSEKLTGVSMNLISLTPLDLSLAAILVLILAVTGQRLGLGLGYQLVIAATRSAVQLTLLGLVLKILFLAPYKSSISRWICPELLGRLDIAIKKARRRIRNIARPLANPKASRRSPSSIARRQHGCSLHMAGAVSAP